MASLKTLLKPHLLYTLLKSPTKPPIYTQFYNSQRKFFTNTQSNLSSNTNPNGKMKKSLDLIFKEAVGLIEDECEIEENNELQKRLKKIERDVRNMKGNLNEKTSKKTVKPRGKSLFSVFTDDPKEKKCDEGGLEEMKEFSSEMKLFVNCLHEKGYFKGANFLRSGELDFSRFSTDYSRGYLRNAAVRFCKDHPEIANCLSESDVRRLALFGCPSDAKKLVFLAKGLRSHFSIQEDMVCRPCVLNDSCKFKYSYVGKKYDELDFANVMKILISYALESGPPQLVLSEEMKDSINNLLRQIVEQSR
ncbi:hypothetical protein ACHQM5_018293 [Ranunculus cassubicifolius]